MKTTNLQTVFVLFSLLFFVQCKKENNVLPSLHKQSVAEASQATLPKPFHIVVVIEENHAYSQIIGSPDAPYINSLLKDPYCVNFSRSYAIAPGSQIDYLDLFSGANQGTNGTSHPENEPFTTPNLGRQLIDAGKTYATYSQSLPYKGYNGDQYGAYVRRHNPAANWMGTGTNQISPSTNKPFTSFPADFTALPTVSFVIPNVNCDMHDGTIKQADTWLRNNMNRYIQYTKTHNALFILTFDEDDGRHDNRIPTLFYGSMVKAGRDTIHINHFDVLRTIEDMYGLPYAGNARYANTIRNCWK
jgi:hypothetical protein